jgi:soluble lytic murein transglycosylase
VHERMATRATRAAAVAIGAALAIAPSSVGSHQGPGSSRPSSAPRARIDPLATLILARMPSAGVELAGALASAVRAGAQRSGLDPLLVMAVIEVESDWEAAAVSGHGARGLMQLRKAAMIEAERAAGALPGDVHDPVHNVRMGIRYLAQMVEKFGDVDLGLMAYNAGPGRLLSYRAADEVPDSVQSYVRKVRREERKLQGEQSRARRSERTVPALCVSSHRSPRPGPGIALDTSTAARTPAMRGPFPLYEASRMSATVVFSRKSRYASLTPAHEVCAEQAPDSRQGRSGRSRHPVRARFPSKGVTISTSLIRSGARASR